MLHIILTILKIIGIIILAILGLIILIAACILFVPIRYNADISYKEKLAINTKITFLLHFISLRYSYEESNLELRILGIRTHFFNKEKKEKNEELNKETEMFEKMSEEISDSNKNITKNMSEKYEQFKKIDKERDKVVNSDVEDIVINKNTKDFVNVNDENNEEENKKEKESIFTKIFSKIKHIFYKIKYRFRSFCGTIKKICKNLGELKGFLSDEHTKEAYYFVKNKLIKLIKHIRPRKIKGYLHFGFDDPSYTGKLLGLIYIFTKGTHKNFQINADFENKVLEGDVKIKGNIKIYFLLILALQLYKNKNLKMVIERRRKNGREQ